jgi:hypothetical protein
MQSKSHRKTGVNSISINGQKTPAMTLELKRMGKFDFSANPEKLRLDKIRLEASRPNRHFCALIEMEFPSGFCPS